MIVLKNRSCPTRRAKRMILLVEHAFIALYSCLVVRYLWSNEWTLMQHRGRTHLPTQVELQVQHNDAIMVQVCGPQLRPESGRNALLKERVPQ